MSWNAVAHVRISGAAEKDFVRQGDFPQGNPGRDVFSLAEIKASSKMDSRFTPSVMSVSASVFFMVVYVALWAGTAAGAFLAVRAAADFFDGRISRRLHEADPAGASFLPKDENEARLRAWLWRRGMTRADLERRKKG